MKNYEGRLYLGPGGIPKPLKDFSFQQENSCRYYWEIRMPGVPVSDNWFDESACETLIEAILKVCPAYEGHKLSLTRLARILLDLGIVVGTGVEREKYPQEQHLRNS